MSGGVFTRPSIWSSNMAHQLRSFVNGRGPTSLVRARLICDTAMHELMLRKSMADVSWMRQDGGSYRRIEVITGQRTAAPVDGAGEGRIVAESFGRAPTFRGAAPQWRAVGCSRLWRQKLRSAGCNAPGFVTVPDRFEGCFATAGGPGFALRSSKHDGRWEMVSHQASQRGERVE